jgi:hypothetical protein
VVREDQVAIITAVTPLDGLTPYLFDPNGRGRHAATPSASHLLRVHTKTSTPTSLNDRH